MDSGQWPFTNHLSFATSWVLADCRWARDGLPSFHLHSSPGRQVQTVEIVGWLPISTLLFRFTNRTLGMYPPGKLYELVTAV